MAKVEARGERCNLMETQGKADHKEKAWKGKKGQQKEGKLPGGTIGLQIWLVVSSMLIPAAMHLCTITHPIWSDIT